MARPEEDHFILLFRSRMIEKFNPVATPRRRWGTGDKANLHRDRTAVQEKTGQVVDEAS